MVLTETKQFGGCVFMTLNDLKIGQSGIITAVGGEGALRLRLLDMGLIPKTRVQGSEGGAHGGPHSDSNPGI